MYFDFLIPKRPVSLQTRNRANLQAWKRYVQTEAARTWSGQIYSGQDIHLTLVYLYESDPVDTDNIVKPIQDALVGLIYEDDLLVTDVESHRRPLTGTFDLTRCPNALIQGIALGIECVYVKVCASRLLEDYL
jgi:crossover junction endodeoxyribonuclease RusA